MTARDEPVVKLNAFPVAEINHFLIMDLANSPIPHRHRIPRIDKYLDSWLNRTQFVKILTDSHSP